MNFRRRWMSTATAVVLIVVFNFGCYGSRLVQVNGQFNVWARFAIRVCYGSYLGSSSQPVSVQVRVMLQSGSVRCSGQTIICRVKPSQSWSTELSVQSGYGFGSSG
ncbi:hypothetical protein Hanom_Chr12g01130671 [Helianthus anomalus]